MGRSKDLTEGEKSIIIKEIAEGKATRAEKISRIMSQLKYFCKILLGGNLDRIVGY